MSFTGGSHRRESTPCHSLGVCVTSNPRKKSRACRYTPSNVSRTRNLAGNNSTSDLSSPRPPHLPKRSSTPSLSLCCVPIIDMIISIFCSSKYLLVGSTYNSRSRFSTLIHLSRIKYLHQVMCSVYIMIVDIKGNVSVLVQRRKVNFLGENHGGFGSRIHHAQLILCHAVAESIAYHTFFYIAPML